MIILECEVCGAAGAGKTAKIGESELVVCEDCASLGEVIGKFSEKKKERKTVKKSSKTSSAFKRKTDKVLKREYGNAVREAREGNDMTMEELAEELKEKKSVIRRIENEELKPDKKLSKKLERELEIELFTELEGERSEFGTDDENLTIGDVAEVK